MKIIQRIALSAVILSAGAAGIAHAQSGATSPAVQTVQDAEAAPRDDMRKGRDRTVAQEDFGARQLDRLKAADADGNGELSTAELEDMVLKQMVERRAQRMTKRLDANGDGTVTLAEVEDRQAKRFAFLDRNGDGKLERSEMRRGHGAHKNGSHRQHGPRGHDAR